MANKKGVSSKTHTKQQLDNYAKPIMIKFIENNKFIEFIAKENTISRFNKLQKQILKYGYSTRDMS